MNIIKVWTRMLRRKQIIVWIFTASFRLHSSVQWPKHLERSKSPDESHRELLYTLKTFPSLRTDRLIFPDSCSSSFRNRPTCSEYRTSQNTQISARSLWMLALHVGSLELRTERLRARHTWRGGGRTGEEAGCPKNISHKIIKFYNLTDVSSCTTKIIY